MFRNVCMSMSAFDDYLKENRNSVGWTFHEHDNNTDLSALDTVFDD